MAFVFVLGFVVTLIEGKTIQHYMFQFGGKNLFGNRPQMR
jgi:hypothetical protein